MKYLFTIGAVLALGVIGTSDLDAQTAQSHLDLEHQMAVVCHQSYQVIDGNLENACGNLIDQVQADGQHEVISANGYFWTEAK
jgi:hypothetical protein